MNTRLTKPLGPNSVPLAVLGAASLLGGCAISTTDLAPSVGTPPRMAIAAPAPDADKLMACFGLRLPRYFDTRGGVPPVIVEATGYFNRNPATLQRLELPTDATLMLESLIASTGHSVAFREATRRDGAPSRSEGGSASAVASTIKVKGDIQIVEAGVEAVSKSLDGSIFGGTADASARGGRQASLAALTLEMTAVDQRGLGLHGYASPLTVVFERTKTEEKSIGASFSFVAIGLNDQKRTVFGYRHALRLGAALQLVTVMSRATKVPASDCLKAVAPHVVDTLPLESVLRDFRAAMGKDPKIAALWLNKLRGLHGRRTDEPLRINSNSATPAGHLAAVAEDSDVGKVFQSGVIDDIALSDAEKEFVYLWARLPDVPSDVFSAGSRWVEKTEAALAAALAHPVARVSKSGVRVVPPVNPKQAAIAPVDQLGGRR